jgi:hypothetical protein
MAATRTDILSSIFCKLIQRLIGVVHNASSRLSVHACSTQGILRVGLQNSESKWRVCSRPSAFPCSSQSSSLCKEKQSFRVTRFVLHTRGVYAPGIGKLLIRELCYWNNVSKEQSQKV